MDLTRLLAPAQIAVVGATERRGSYGAQTLINLGALGFPGPVWGVNPRHEEVLGRPCVGSLADLPGPVDAVVIAIPAAGVAEVVEQAGALGCGGAVVYGAGFAEVASGRAEQDALVAAARRHSLPVCGPNGSGIVAMASRAAMWGDALPVRETGHVALVSQSGNVAVNALAAMRGLRFHTVVSSGNQAVLRASDYLTALAADEDVHAIALYLEDDGDGAALCDALAACADAGTPVVVLKVGASAAGAAAAAAHTGALAGDQRVFRALIEDAGAVWARDVHELLELAKTLAVTRRLAPHARLAILTCSGGDSSQGADEAAALGLELAELAPATAQRLAPLLHEAATIANPLDYTATIWGDAGALAEIVTAVGEDPSIDQLLVFYDQLPGLEGARGGVLACGEGRDRGGRPPLARADDGLLDAPRAPRRRRGVALRAVGCRRRRGASHRHAGRGGDAPRAGDPAALRAIAAAVRARAGARRRARGSPSTSRRRCCAPPASRSSTVARSTGCPRRSRPSPRSAAPSR